MKSACVFVPTKRLLIALPILLMLLFGDDYLWLRFRISHPEAGKALDTVEFYWATPLKDGKEEIFLDQPQTETCVHSLFPHLGHKPCWYGGEQTVRVIR